MSTPGAGPAPIRCGRCGRNGRLGKRATSTHPDLCQPCYRADAQPRRRCGICGETRTIRVRARDGQPDTCARCVSRPVAACGICGRVTRISRKATATSPAVGRCCYRLPVATCSVCGRRRPCERAASTEPICSSCRSARRTRRCADCGQDRRAARKVDGGVLCASCDFRRGGTVGACRDCGTDGTLLTGRCPACRLRARVAQLTVAADPTAAATLAPYLRALASSPNPASTLRWMYGSGFRLLEDLLAGRVEIGHAGLDLAQGDASESKTVGHLRAALVTHGALEARDEPSAAFARWQQRATSQITAGPDRTHLRAYATWHVAHQLTRSSRRARSTPAAQKYARSLLIEAIKLTRWLHDSQLQLRDLHQDVVDTWVADGASIRRRIKLFLAWLTRAGIINPLHVAWQSTGPRGGALDDRRRLELLRRLLHDNDADPRDRLAGCLVLLYAQPSPVSRRSRPPTSSPLQTGRPRSRSPAAPSRCRSRSDPSRSPCAPKASLPPTRKAG